MCFALPEVSVPSGLFGLVVGEGIVLPPSANALSGDKAIALTSKNSSPFMNTPDSIY
jgi:hypothetical protein